MFEVSSPQGLGGWLTWPGQGSAWPDSGGLGWEVHATPTASLPHGGRLPSSASQARTEVLTEPKSPLAQVVFPIILRAVGRSFFSSKGWGGLILLTALSKFSENELDSLTTNSIGLRFAHT